MIWARLSKKLVILFPHDEGPLHHYLYGEEHRISFDTVERMANGQGMDTRTSR